MSSSSPSRAVLITGCSSGIGRATALRLAGAGHLVYATARHREALADLAARGCRTLTLDVTDEASMAAAVHDIEAREGAVGVLVNNAGYDQEGAIEAVPIARMRAQFETNVFGAVRLAQLVLPAMRGQRFGRIVNLSSMGGRVTFPGAGVYHASKYAVEALSDALRFEVAGFGIDVVLIEPGFIRTGFVAAADATWSGIPDAGPYAAFHRAVARKMHRAYERGPLAMLGGAADDVARVIQRAIEAPKPRARYTVTPSAKLFIANRRLLPDRAWDALLRLNFPVPRPEDDATARA